MTTFSMKLLKQICLMGIIGLGVLSIIASGGSNDQSVGDGDGIVTIKNRDDKDYKVELRKFADNSVIGSATVFAFDVGDNDWILRFEDVPNGDFYLVIFRGGVEQDRSGSFSITGKDERCYEIDEDGDIQKC